MVDIDFCTDENSTGREKFTIQLMKNVPFVNSPLRTSKTFMQIFVIEDLSKLLVYEKNQIIKVSEQW